MKILKLLPLFILTIFLFQSVSATVVLGGLWNNNQNSITINNGQTTSFTAAFGSTESSMTINIKLYDANYNLIYTFENNKAIMGVSHSTYSQIYSITPAIYQNPGNYHLIFLGTDSDGSNTYTINLIVNPVVPPTNSTPVISSPPITTVNESSPYSYQVIASDADGDKLTYSLTQTPLFQATPQWIYINSSTGLVSGTAPSENADTNYTININVSDGQNIATQNYILTVVNTNTNTTDTVPPIVHLSYFYINSSSISLSTNATDDIALSNLTFYVWNQTDLFLSISVPVTGISNSAALGFTAPDGNYIWNVLGVDAAGNANWSQEGNYTFSVDTTAPQIQFVNPTPVNNSVLNSTTIPVNLTVSDLVSGLNNFNVYLYNSTGKVNNVSGNSSQFAFSFINLQAGIYYLNATATDNVGNINQTPTIIITLQSLNNQTNQSNQTNPVNVIYYSNPYTYNDVYNNPITPQQSNNNTAQPLNLEAPQTQKSSSGYIPILIAETVLVLGALITTLVITIRRLRR